MIHKIHHYMPKPLSDELLRVARADRNWIEVDDLGGKDYRIRVKPKTWVRGVVNSGADGFSLVASSIWLLDGPKVMELNDEQCNALEQVEVRLTIEDYHQPYSALMVTFPEGRYHPFESILCYCTEMTSVGKVLVFVGHSIGRAYDITTTISSRGSSGEQLEIPINKFYDDVTPAASKPFTLATRVAINACLALANYNHHLEYLLPKEVERDKSLGREQSERGAKARERVRLAIKAAKLDSSVRLHRVEGGGSPGEPTGREMRCHWRRGHWHTVLHGVGKSLRKLAFFPPVLVRADRAIAETSEMTTTYK